MDNFIGELLGTMFLIIFGGGVVANVLLAKSKGQGGGWISITAGWGIAVMVGVFVAQAAGAANADINPAVTFARYLLGQSYSFSQMLIIICAEFIGAFFGAIVVWLAYLGHWQATNDSQLKLLVFSTSPAIRNFPRNLLNEIIGTTVLVVGVGAIFGGVASVHPISAGVGPYLVGVLVWGIGLSLGGPTGYAINPARDLGPRLAHFLLPIVGKGSSEWSYAWVPIVGPLIGSVVGAVIWKFLLK